jgi:murein tripeptide amidase MpaA
VVEYIANKLVSGYKTDPAVEAIVDNHDIYIFPIANPDGKLFSSDK